jgi:hypothetical protein
MLLTVMGSMTLLSVVCTKCIGIIDRVVNWVHAALRQAQELAQALMEMMQRAAAAVVAAGHEQSQQAASMLDAVMKVTERH